MLAYSIDDKDSFKGLIQWREEFLKYADVKSEYFPFIVIGNKVSYFYYFNVLNYKPNIKLKADIDSSQRQVTPEEVNYWCQEHHVASFIETSSKLSTNVNESFVLAVRQWQKLEKSTERDLRAQGDTIDLTKSVNMIHSRQNCCSGLGFGKNNVENHDED